MPTFHRIKVFWIVTNGRGCPPAQLPNGPFTFSSSMWKVQRNWMPRRICSPLSESPLAACPPAISLLQQFSLCQLWVTHFRVLCTLESQSPTFCIQKPVQVLNPGLSYSMTFLLLLLPLLLLRLLTKVAYVFLQSIVLFLWWNASQVHAMVATILRGFEPIRL